MIPVDTEHVPKAAEALQIPGAKVRNAPAPAPRRGHREENGCHAAFKRENYLPATAGKAPPCGAIKAHCLEYVGWTPTTSPTASGSAGRVPTDTGANRRGSDSNGIALRGERRVQRAESTAP